MIENKEIVVINPATGIEIGRVPIHSETQVRDKVGRAAAAQREWARLPIESRCAQIRRLAEAIADHAQALADLIVAESGKPYQEALIHELAATTAIIAWCAAKAPKILATRKIRPSALWFHRRALLHYVPRGVVGIISPWNSPLNIPVGEVAAALIAGNAAVLKPSELAPLTPLKIKEIYDASGMIADLFQVVTGYGDTGEALLRSGVNKVSFTGSVESGKKVAAICGELLTPCTLELGGKAPALVLDDADLDRTARALVWGAFANSGQLCTSIERVYAHEKIHDRLVEKLVTLTNRLRVGNPADGEVDLGTMTSLGQIDRVDRLVQDARANGAVVLTGGLRPKGPGTFYPPTVVAGARQDMPILRDEIFGPVLPIMKVRDEAEAVRLANESHLGLNAYVFSASRSRSRDIAGRVEAGSVMINDVLSNYPMPEAPFGGWKQSGIGWVHGEEGLRGMCATRVVYEQRLPLPTREFGWYPYSQKLAQRGLKAFSTVARFLGRLMRL